MGGSEKRGLVERYSSAKTLRSCRSTDGMPELLIDLCAKYYRIFGAIFDLCAKKRTLLAHKFEFAPNRQCQNYFPMTSSSASQVR
jgi:hypothetical protein